MDFFKKGGLSDIHHLYMDRSRIYQGMSRNRLEVGPTIILAGINRNADAIGEKPSKMAFFSWFSKIYNLFNVNDVT